MKKASANKRIQWFHKTVSSGGYPNTTLLCERFHISLSQAKRDIHFLKETLNAPLAYNAAQRGYYYTSAYSLPVAATATNDESFSGLVATAGAADNPALEFCADHADVTFLQLQIPYTAILEIPDKLAVAELKSYVHHAERASKELRKNCYKCEFHSVERFLGILLSIEADVRIVSPKWLREKLIASAERILRMNPPIEDDDDEE